MKNSTFYLWSLIAFCYLQSCTYDKGEVPVPIPPINSAPYQSTIKPIIVTYCYGHGTQTCHVTPSSEGANGDFTTYAGLKQKVVNGSLQTRVFNLKNMPASYSQGPTALSPEDLEKLKIWVNNGALNN